MNSHTDTIVDRADPIRIALADDHPVFRDGLRKLLSLERDFEVVAEAQDGTEVVDILIEVEPDVLLLDLSMPQHDGIAALNQDFHFGPGTVAVYTRAAPKTTSFRAEPCTSPPPVGARARPSAHRR